MICRRRTFRLLSLCAMAATSLAQAPVPPSEAKGFATIQERALREDLSFLASDRLAGRMSLQPGDDEAAQWVAAEFRKAGLKPAAMDASGKPSFLQTFQLVEYRPDRGESSVTLTRAGKTTVWHAPQASGAYKHAADLTAPVVFAGFGITAPELGYDDYKSLDAKGRIVLLFDHEPQENDPRSIFNGHGQHALCHDAGQGAQRAGARSSRGGGRRRTQPQAPDQCGAQCTYWRQRDARHSASAAGDRG